MIIRTEATALLIRPWSKSSHIVTWLTPDHGRITTSVKGACRPKSQFLGQYDLYYTCELLFYRRVYNDIHAIRECTPLRLREPLRYDWRASLVASYLVNLVSGVSDSHHDCHAIYTLLNQELDRLSEGGGRSYEENLLRFELSLLVLLGVMPDLALCGRCHPPERQWLRFSLSSGRFICPHLARAAPGDPALSLHREVRDFLLELCPSLSAVERSDGEKNLDVQQLLFGSGRFLGIFMYFHLDVLPSVRHTLLEILDENPAPTTAP